MLALTLSITILLLIITLFLLFVILMGFFFTIDFFLDLPYVATKREKIPTIIKLAGIKKEERVVDLGSGDGRLLLAAAQKGARAIGYEINPFLILLTRIKAYLYSYSFENSVRGPTSRNPQSLKRSDLQKGSVIVKRQNLWKANFKEADVIFVYGRRKDMPKFEKFVFKNAKKGTRIIVNTNPFPNKRPLKSESGIFLYKT